MELHFFKIVLLCVLDLYILLKFQLTYWSYISQWQSHSYIQIVFVFVFELYMVGHALMLFLCMILFLRYLFQDYFKLFKIIIVQFSVTNISSNVQFLTNSSFLYSYCAICVRLCNGVWTLGMTIQPPVNVLVCNQDFIPYIVFMVNIETIFSLIVRVYTMLLFLL